VETFDVKELSLEKPGRNAEAILKKILAVYLRRN
jgi:hypothetical protein